MQVERYEAESGASGETLEEQWCGFSESGTGHLVDLHNTHFRPSLGNCYWPNSAGSKHQARCLSVQVLERKKLIGWLGSDVHLGSNQLWPGDGAVKTKHGCQVLPCAPKGYVREVPSSGVTESCHTPSAGALCSTLSPVTFLP